MSATSTTSRRTDAAFWSTAAALLALIAGTEIPTPLYVLYRNRFGLSNTMLTTIFATYALALIPTLLIGGRLADRFGRRRLVVAGLLGAAVGSMLLAMAAGTAGLLAGRAVQGMAVGIATGAATAALVELDTRGGRAASVATSAVAGGGAVGPLLGGLLAQYAPSPSVLSYSIETVALLAIAAAVSTTGDWPLPSGPGTAKPSPRIPPEIRIRFARIGIGVFTAWSVGALYTSVVPSYAVELLGTRNLAVLGAVAFLMLATAAATQSTLRSIPDRIAEPTGFALLIAGLIALVIAFPTQSARWLATSAVLDGIGLGLAFLSTQAELNRIAPPDRRAELSAAFNVCLYCGVAFPVLGVGIAADVTSLFSAVAAFAAVIGTLAALTIGWTLRGRRSPVGRNHAAESSEEGRLAETGCAFDRQ
ncbi:MFS transporter [Nocardia arthritidis]|uniref:MFS transporter n=1 Tax=Nocardia arthritidis TaxID=228602 RepID=A0A6G9YTA7_9NOCA|nr:MFS transporter [Nocardia arthritidis]QIS16331.1 MFS transporter [Nocardia arthritidis]